MVMPKARLQGGSPSTSPAAQTVGPRASTANRGTFNFQRRTPESLAKRAQQYATGDKDWFLKDGTATFTPQAGDNWVRILPATWENPEHYAWDVRIHYQVGADKGAFLCLAEMKNEACPICEEYTQAVREKDDDYAKELKANKTLLVWMLDRNKESEGPKIWTMPVGIDRELVALQQDTRTGEILFIEDADTGYDVEFKRQGAGMQTKYIGVRIARQPSMAASGEVLEYISRNPIPSLLTFHDYDYIARAFTGQSAPASERTAEEPAARPTAPARPLTSAAAPARAPLRARPVEAPVVEEQAGTYTFEDIQALDLNGLVDIALENGIEIPENVPDDKVADVICEAMQLQPSSPRASAPAASPRARLAALPGRKT